MKNSFFLSTKIPLTVDQEYKNKSMEKARHTFASRLYEEIINLPSPVAVDISEEIGDTDFVSFSPYANPHYFDFTISAKLNPIKHRSYEYEILTATPRYAIKKMSFTEKLKWLFSNE